jgi:ABC-2 type transport system ATP-binding protein
MNPQALHAAPPLAPGAAAARYEPVTAAAPPSVLTARDVSLRYRSQTVLHHVNLTVPEGAVVGLVGRNGAGKSSLLRCLLGLTLPDSGQCELLGCPSVDLSDEVRARLGYAAQNPDLFDRLTADQHFTRLAGWYPRWSTERALVLAAQWELPLARKARDLSLGDQQKLSVILALAHDPDLLILDEPVASLDPLSRRAFMRALFERGDHTEPGGRERARTVLISSHLLTDLERVVTHVAFLRRGRVQLFGAWDELAEHVRLLELPAGSSPLPTTGVLHRRELAGSQRVLFDDRHADAPPASGRPLNLEDLFAELNT